MRFMYSSPSDSSVNIVFRPAQASATNSWYWPMLSIAPVRATG